MTISAQMTKKVEDSSKMKRKRKFDGSTEQMISTGSTLLDLAISGGRVREGGIPGGILVEIFGPASSGKTILLCEIAGGVARQAGKVMFKDPEARLNKQFAKLFGLDVATIDYSIPQTVPEVFKPVRLWNPGSDVINGVFADSLAALSTEMELDEKDQYGMRRAKEFSEELRKTCRILTEKNFLMVCSNQIRENLDAGQFGQKYKSPGGQAIGFYSSLRLRMVSTQKIIRKSTVHRKEMSRVIGVNTTVEVYKSSVWEPFHTAPLTILFDYGIDDIRANLQFVKDCSGEAMYVLGEQNLDKSMEGAIGVVEKAGLEGELKKEVIDLWHKIEKKFKIERKPKHR